MLGDYKGTRAISRTGRLALEEASECRVTILDVATGDLVYRFGRCGEGPGEFKAIHSLYFEGDTLFVIDGALKSATAISPSGTLIGRVPLDQLWGTARVDPSGVQRVNDTLLLGVIRTMWKDSGQVAVIDRNARRVVNSFMRQPAAVIASKAAFPHSVWACVIAPDTAPLIAIAGQYEFEGIGAELSGQVLWRSLTPLAWAGPRGVGERIVAAGYSLDPVCSDSSVMLRMSRTHSDAPVNAPVEPGLVEIRAKNGRLLFSSDDPALGEYLIGAGIAWGKFWAFNDPNSERPRLRVYELVPR